MDDIHEQEKTLMDLIEVKRLYPVKDGGNLLAYAEVTIDDNITVYGVRLMTGKCGLFVSIVEPIGENDYYFHRPGMGEFEAISYNPDSSAGGQFVVQHIPYELISEAKKNSNSPNGFYEHLDSNAYTELIDVGTQEFADYLKVYVKPEPGYIGQTEATMQVLISQAEEELKTQDEFEYNGYHFVPIGNIKSGYTLKEIGNITLSNNSLGMSAYSGSRFPYSYDSFYLAAQQSEADVFRCIETGKLYLPGNNELFEYVGDFTLLTDAGIKSFDALEFERHIPNSMRFKQTNAVNNMQMADLGDYLQVRKSSVNNLDGGRNQKDRDTR